MSSANDDFDRMLIEFFRDDPLTATYHQYTEGQYNPATSTYDTVQVDTTVDCIIMDFDRMTNGQSSKFGKEILQGDKDFYMLPKEKSNPSATPIIPNPTSDRITVGGTVYKIVTMKEANPQASAPLLYNMMLRR